MLTQPPSDGVKGVPHGAAVRFPFQVITSIICWEILTDTFLGSREALWVPVLLFQIRLS